MVLFYICLENISIKYISPIFLEGGRKMKYKEIHQMFHDPENVKQQVLNDDLYSDEEIINIVEEYNKDKSRFSPKRLNTKQVVKGYHRTVNRVQKNIAKETEREKKRAEKELEAILEATGLTLEEYNNLTPMERAQLKMQLEQTKHIKNMSAMQAMNSISNGFDKL